MSDPQMTLLHLSTGHIVSAVAAGKLSPTVDDLTGGKAIAVRVEDKLVLVTGDLLKAKVAPLDTDVLTRPTAYRVVDGIPPVSFAGRMDALDTTTPLGTEGTKCLSLWQAGDELEPVADVLDSDGQPSVDQPPGATHRLFACPGQPLLYTV
jgi:hypothetical protein